MVAIAHDFVVEQGANWERVIWLRDDRNNVVSLSGYTALMQVRLTPDSASALLELSTENGKISISADLGQITLALTAAQTATLAFSEGVYDLQITKTSTGKVTRVLEGNFVVSPSVTV